MKTPTRYFDGMDYDATIEAIQKQPHLAHCTIAALQEENARLRGALKMCPALGCESQILNEWWDSVAMPALAQTMNSHEALVNALEAVSRLACLEEYSAIYKQVQSALALAKV